MNNENNENNDNGDINEKIIVLQEDIDRAEHEVRIKEEFKSLFCFRYFCL